MMDKERYKKYMRRLKHRKMREIMLSAPKLFLHAPETAFKVLFLVCFPKLYYAVKSII